MNAVILILGFASAAFAQVQGNSCTPRFVLDSALNCKNLNQEIVIVKEGVEVKFSTDGFTSQGKVVFSSGVIIVGDLEVRSTRQKAIYLPEGGIHLSTEDNANAPPGQMFAKNIKTSTITLVGSAIIFEDKFGVAKATMTSSSLSIDGVNAGKVQNKNTGSGAPASGGCDDESEFGLQYISRTPSRLYICADNGAGGYGWRYTNISP